MSAAGPAVHFATMSSPSEKSAENVKDGAEAVVQTLDSDGNRGTAVERPRVLRMSRKAQLSAYFTIAAAAFGLIRYALHSVEIALSVRYSTFYSDGCKLSNLGD